MKRASGSSTVRTFSLLRSAAVDALERARADEHGRFYQCLHSMIASAFALEAYLNHMGEHEKDLWPGNPRLKIHKKFRRVCRSVGLNPDYESRPYSSFERLVDFRNDVAHGRTEAFGFSDSIIRDGEGVPPALRSSLEETVTVDSASVMLNDVEEIMKAIHQAGGGVLAPYSVTTTAAWVETD